MCRSQDYCRIAQSIRPMVLVSNRLSYRSASRQDHQGEKMVRIYCDQIRTILRPSTESSVECVAAIKFC